VGLITEVNTGFFMLAATIPDVILTATRSGQIGRRWAVRIPATVRCSRQTIRRLEAYAFLSRARAIEVCENLQQSRGWLLEVFLFFLSSEWQHSPECRYERFTAAVGGNIGAGLKSQFPEIVPELKFPDARHVGLGDGRPARSGLRCKVG